MSFQGDVGGIGLSDLLQSLARGREGVLTLNVKSGLRATVGMQDGQIHLLPDAEEDPEFWRNRVRQAWVMDPDFRVDALRMTDIARSQRIETLYCLLDSDQVHFRFLPGPVPTKAPEPAALGAGEPGTARPQPGGARRDAVYCAPTSVEGLLLEYARLKDEQQSANIRFRLPDHALLVPHGPQPEGNDTARMFEELDGRSTLVEIADRLCWPLRQLRILASIALIKGAVRPPTTDELLEFALRELVDGNRSRAATRLRGWIELSPPGPLYENDVSGLTTEWQANRLQPLLADLGPREARTLLRRLEVTQGQPLASIEYWTEFLRVFPGDRLAAVSLLIAEIKNPHQTGVPSLKDIIAVARAFQKDGHERRAAALWRVAAARHPETTEQRLEIGLGLIAAGLGVEGLPWILEAAGTLIDQGRPELAIEPLKRVLGIDPSLREARRLYSRARTLTVQRTITRKHSLVTMAIVLALAIGGVVTFQANRDTEKKISAITAHLSDPHEALRLLDESFPDEAARSARVRDLRATIVQDCKVEDNAARTAWTDRYREAQLECTIGEPKLGLERALALPPAPRLAEDQEPLPLASDLFNGLSARLEKSLTDLGPEIRDDEADAHAEEALLARMKELSLVLEGIQTPSVEAREFAARLVLIGKRVQERDKQRKAERAERLRVENLQRQDLLLATARAQAKAGDYVRSMEAYQKLLASDQTGKLAGLLQKEMKDVQDRGGALVTARAQALAGKHDDALKTLAGAGEGLLRTPLPWRLETFPAGAEVRLKDGSTRTTPAVFETVQGETFELTLASAGFAPATVRVAGPRDQLVHLSRLPERAWPGRGRIEALPVAVHGGHLVCDRSGSVALLAANGQTAWTRVLGTLGGIARTPIELPGARDRWLFLTEDGESWILDAATGAPEGPGSLPTQPLEGPIRADDGIVARLRDGSLAHWTNASAATIASARDLGPEHLEIERALSRAGAYGVHGEGWTVLRRRTDVGTRVASPASGAVVEARDGHYFVRRKGEPEPAFAIRGQGEWTYFAWEAPTPEAPLGRLWIADEGGLASYLP